MKLFKHISKLADNISNYLKNWLFLDRQKTVTRLLTLKYRPYKWLINQLNRR